MQQRGPVPTPQRSVWRSAGRLTDPSGAAAVEFAIVLPLLALLLLGLVDYGVGFWEAMMVGNAARAGAYYAAVNGWASTGTTNDANIDAAVTNATQLSVTASSSYQCMCPTASGTTITGLTAASGTPPACDDTNCTGVTPNVPAGNYIQVNAQANYSPLIAFTGLAGLGFNYSISSSAITLKATAYARR
jgi:Flp pilus assembly protein TadG